jgi:hypothetical protein
MLPDETHKFYPGVNQSGAILKIAFKETGHDVSN